MNDFHFSGDAGNDPPPPRDPPSKRVRRIQHHAESIARQEVGSASEWEHYTAQAEGEVKWEDFEQFLKKQGWKFVEKYDYKIGRFTAYEVLRYHFHLDEQLKKFIPRHRDAEGVFTWGRDR